VANWPAASHAAHINFCRTEGWFERQGGRDETGDHYRYELALSDGTILYTRISHPPDKRTYGARMWSEILSSQLMVTEDVFWNCVQNGVVPDRGDKVAENATKERALPLWLVDQLLKTGEKEEEIRSLSEAAARERLDTIRARPPSQVD
jgi:hypothetical protein